MSIKRISRTRVVAPVTEYVDEEPLAKRVGTMEDWRASRADETRVGGNVETKASPALESSRDLQSRVGSNVETRTGTEVESRYGKGR